MPHLHSIFQALWSSARPGGVGPLLITILFHAALFTAKEAAVGFALGAVLGFALGALLAHFRILARGFLPWVVASQTVPILVVAPMVVVWLNPKLPGPLQDWGAVAVIAAYLTFFPVLVNTLRGLTSVNPRALELMHSYAAGQAEIFRRVRIPTAPPFIFTGLKVATVLAMIGAVVGEYFGGALNALGVLILTRARVFPAPAPAHA
jgi:NitT/TauT family transport system permease protein